ncbi:MAG: hypothetical protein HC888_05295 [Candidatus Competibacteraceae bacterium]|nr:hypothetical protein [Candidatus Competibacteraceae bacterium]
MPLAITLGPNHTLEINGAKITVSRDVRVYIHDKADIKITAPSGVTKQLSKGDSNDH